jgi:hypothetical protein
MGRGAGVGRNPRPQLPSGEVQGGEAPHPIPDHAILSHPFAPVSVRSRRGVPARSGGSHLSPRSGPPVPEAPGGASHVPIRSPPSNRNPAPRASNSTCRKSAPPLRGVQARGIARREWFKLSLVMVRRMRSPSRQASCAMGRGRTPPPGQSLEWQAQNVERDLSIFIQCINAMTRLVPDNPCSV